jgi:hypothetical protein
LESEEKCEKCAGYFRLFDKYYQCTMELCDVKYHDKCPEFIDDYVYFDCPETQRAKNNFEKDNEIEDI